MRVFNPRMINLAYVIGVPGSAGGELREAVPGRFYAGSDGNYYIVNDDGTIDRFSSQYIFIDNLTQEVFDSLRITLTEISADI